MPKLPEIGDELEIRLNEPMWRALFENASNPCIGSPRMRIDYGENMVFAHIVQVREHRYSTVKVFDVRPKSEGDLRL